MARTKKYLFFIYSGRYLFWTFYETIKYETENVLVCRYLRELNLEDYIGTHDPKHVVVLADSGYDTKDIEKTIASRKWHYIIALKKKRTAKTVKLYETTARSKDWLQVAILFKRYRCLKWSTVRVPVNSTRKKRMEFRIRQVTGYLRNVGKTQLICSEFKKRPQGRRKYLACNDLKAAPRQILIGYRLRWAIEIFGLGPDFAHLWEETTKRKLNMR